MCYIREVIGAFLRRECIQWKKHDGELIINEYS